MAALRGSGPFAAALLDPAGLAVIALAAGLFAAGAACARRAASYTLAAESERLVAERLRPPEARGWAVLHSIPSRGHGDKRTAAGRPLRARDRASAWLPLAHAKRVRRQRRGLVGGGTADRAAAHADADLEVSSA
ncbi:MAG TPA: hypothetical protein VGU26_10605 [Gaiellaceae bacterium]|nr:hypothetical protein [Gaiellaceae bacterium]